MHVFLMGFSPERLPFSSSPSDVAAFFGEYGVCCPKWGGRIFVVEKKNRWYTWKTSLVNKKEKATTVAGLCSTILQQSSKCSDVDVFFVCRWCFSFNSFWGWPDAEDFFNWVRQNLRQEHFLRELSCELTKQWCCWWQPEIPNNHLGCIPNLW